MSPIAPAAWHRPETPPGTDWFGEEVRRILIDHFGAETTTQGGLSVRTSLSPVLQAAADKALAERTTAATAAAAALKAAQSEVELLAAEKSQVDATKSAMAAPAPRGP